MHRRQFPDDGGVERIEIEADPRHAQIFGSTVNNLSDQLKLVGTPGVRVPLPDVDVEFNDDARRRYLSMAVRLGYVAQDLLARDVSNPTERSEVALKRVCQFPLGSGRLCDATATQIGQGACGHADQQVAPCCLCDRVVFDEADRRCIVFWRKRLLRTRENVLSCAEIASSRVRLWSYTRSAGVRGQHRVQAFFTLRICSSTPCIRTFTSFVS